jgi:twitching motility protein PilT
VRIAIDRQASDVHLRAGLVPHLRVQGRVRPLAEIADLSGEQLQAALTAWMPETLQATWAKQGAVMFSQSFEERARLRFSIFADHLGIAATCRLLPLEPPSPEDLQLPPLVAKLTNQEQGLILLSGPQGSGCTSTLAALLSSINSDRYGHLVTIESPIEFLHRPKKSLITQFEVPGQVPTFAAGLRRAARIDADVCAVSDVSKPEVLDMACALAEKGLLVIGIVQLPNVVAVMEFLLDSLTSRGRQQAPERVLRVLRCVSCQRLCRARVSGEGVLPVFETLVMNPTAVTMIRQGRFRDLHQAMIMTFNNGLVGHVKNRKISVREALQQAADPEELKTLLQNVREF